jgi:hypothetical protein
VNITRADGTRRLDDPNDVVRLEVEAALQSGMSVIPVLVQGATMPSAADLPDTLRPLASRNGQPVRYDPDFDTDVRRVMNALEPLLHVPAAPAARASASFASNPVSYGQPLPAPLVYPTYVTPGWVPAPYVTTVVNPPSVLTSNTRQVANSIALAAGALMIIVDSVLTIFAARAAYSANGGALNAVLVLIAIGFDIACLFVTSYRAVIQTRARGQANAPRYAPASTAPLW